MPSVSNAQLAQHISHPWGKPDDMDLLMERIGEARYVLLGEASHGTHEYYLWRARLSERLIREKQFTFIAVEGDWPDCYRVNRYIKCYKDSGDNARDSLHAFNRWPTWMWANEDVLRLVERLRDINAKRRPEARVGFYGLDVYSLWDSMRAVVNYLEKIDPAAAARAKQLYRCFEPYNESTETYAYRSAFVPESCEEDVVQALKLLRRQTPEYATDHEAAFNAQQNALVAVNAEHYYRTMVRGDAASWNIRDSHMMETLHNLMRRYGSTAKAIVWAHNTHIGDARYTNMADAGMVNVGELVREADGEDNTVLVGFGTYEGSVIAGQFWDAPMEVMNVPAALPGSWENLLHGLGLTSSLLLSDELAGRPEFSEPLGQRAIGVVYDPRHEHGNYVPTILPRRYDAFVYLDRTQALKPLHLVAQPNEDYPEDFPWGT